MRIEICVRAPIDDTVAAPLLVSVREITAAGLDVALDLWDVAHIDDVAKRILRDLREAAAESGRDLVLQFPPDVAALEAEGFVCESGWNDFGRPAWSPARHPRIHE